MKDVCLDELLENLAEAVNIDNARVNGVLQGNEEAYRFSFAARQLHKALHNNPDTRPKWFNQGYRNDDFHDTGMSILDYVSSWHTRSLEHERETRLFREDYICDRKSKGLDCDVENMSFIVSVDNSKYPENTDLEVCRMGFDLNELIPFLDKEKIKHTLKFDSELSPSTANNQDDDNVLLFASNNLQKQKRRK